jgi:hypothetical protein
MGEKSRFAKSFVLLGRLEINAFESVSILIYSLEEGGNTN